MSNNQVSRRLLRSHTHRGVRYPPGAIITTLDPTQAEWLDRQGVSTADLVAKPDNLHAPLPGTLVRRRCCGW